MHESIRSELARLGAAEVRTEIDEEFEPGAGELIKVQTADAYWHLLPAEFLELLRGLPDGAGSAAVHRAIETDGHAVWHGPSPRRSIDTSS